MNWTTSLYIYFTAKAFNPFLSFMVPFLIEEKGFKNEELYNTLNPFFFVASMLASLVAFLIIELLGNKNTLIADNIMETLVYIVILIMPKRHFPLGILSCLLHGATTSINVVTKSILLETAPKDITNLHEILPRYNTYKAITGVFASWIGQDIILCGGNYYINLIMSIVRMLVTTAVVLPLQDTPVKQSGEKLIKLLSEPAILWRRMRNAYDKETTMISLLNTSGGILYICFAFFTASIFLEKRNQSNLTPSNNTWRIFQYMFRPLRLVSRVFITLASLFTSTVSYKTEAVKPAVVHGYIDGLSKITTSIVSRMISVIPKTTKEIAIYSFVSSLITMAATYYLGRTKSLTNSYVLYIIASAGAASCKNIAGNGLIASLDRKFVLSMNLFLSSIIHMAISVLTKKANLHINQKLTMYFYVTLFLNACAFLIFLSLSY